MSHVTTYERVMSNMRMSRVTSASQSSQCAVAVCCSVLLKCSPTLSRWQKSQQQFCDMSIHTHTHTGWGCRYRYRVAGQRCCPTACEHDIRGKKGVGRQQHETREASECSNLPVHAHRHAHTPLLSTCFSWGSAGIMAHRPCKERTPL
jgi:hypothetical protein